MAPGRPADMEPGPAVAPGRVVVMAPGREVAMEPRPEVAPGAEAVAGFVEAEEEAEDEVVVGREFPLRRINK